MNIIVRIITGALQDADNDSYDRVVRVYLFLAAASVVVGLAILVGSLTNESLRPLQWTRKRRMTVGAEHIEKQREWHLVTCYNRSRVISLCCFCALMMLVLGGWVAYIWGAVTGNNS
jgi:predicted DNA-binding transcriptional regulator